MLHDFAPAAFFELSDDSWLTSVMYGFTHVWEIFGNLRDIVLDRVGGQRPVEGHIMAGSVVPEECFYLGPGSVVEPGAYIEGPAYIGSDVGIRHGAYVRANCIFLEGSVLDHCSEAKNCVFLPYAKAAHFAYVGDSILGSRVNLGTSVKLSNLPLELSGTRKPIVVKHGGHEYATRLTKLGAVLGDGVQIGGNAMTNPATFVQPRSYVYPGSVVPSGLYPSGTLIKSRHDIEISRLRSLDDER